MLMKQTRQRDFATLGPLRSLANLVIDISILRVKGDMEIEYHVATHPSIQGLPELQQLLRIFAGKPLAHEQIQQRRGDLFRILPQ